MQIQSPLSVGLFAGKWCSYAAAPDLPHDQREEDGGALTFDSDHLEENLEILGPPIAEFELSADQPVAMIAVRLSDIAPDDKATRITYGLLNLTHRESSEAPQPLEPGKRYRIRVQLNDVAQSFPKGHRLRLSVSTSYWPLAWPPPNPVRLTIYTGACRLFLPIRPPRLDDQRLRAFDDPEGAAPCEQTMIEPPNHNWRVIRDLAKDQSTLHVVKDEGVKQLDDIDLVVRDRIDEWYIYREDDFTAPAMAAPRRFFATTGQCRTHDGEARSEDTTLAARNALLNMIEYLVVERGYTDQQAYAICSVAVDLRISEVVDVPNFLVSAFLPLDIFTE